MAEASCLLMVVIVCIRKEGNPGFKEGDRKRCRYLNVIARFSIARKEDRYVIEKSSLFVPGQNV